jgi:hypothetical protein
MSYVLDLQTLETPACTDEIFAASHQSNQCCSCLSLLICN